MSQVKYTEENIISLDWKEHIRLRPGMYIGKLGDGSMQDDGIYVLLKEVIDNSIDEHVMGYGKTIDIEEKNGLVRVRDYGRGIPLGKVVECVSQINTGGKYDSKAFKKSVGLNGVGTKAVNALSSHFKVEAFRDGKSKSASFERGDIREDSKVSKTGEVNGTLIEFRPDEKIFSEYQYVQEHVDNQLWNYAWLNAGLRLRYNGKSFYSKQGLLDLLEKKTAKEKLRYPIIHLQGDDIELVLTHGQHYGEQYYSFVNGQNTVQGGTHLQSFREAVVKTVRDFFNKSFDSRDVRASMIGAISIRVEEPVFESQTKTKLGSLNMAPDGPTVRSFILDFVTRNLDNYLHKHQETAQALLKRIQQSERERKELAGIKKLANKRAKSANLHNKKLRDCRFHYNEKSVKPELRNETTIFITEGDSASGSITKARNVETQAVFSLRGKPLNCYGMSKKIVYQNEELNLLQHALNIEDDLDELRYNRVVIATDADVDGMHIRLLLLTFFLQFFPELIREKHLYILETPLFRVRNKQKTIYCYSGQEKEDAIKALSGKVEITRFKGLGEISPGEFEDFIGKDMRLSPVQLTDNMDVDELLQYYMGKNTPSRQEFIIDNLRVQIDEVDEDEDIAMPEEPVIAETEMAE